LRTARRGWHGLGRALGGKAVVHYFHQPDDPYSQLAAQLLVPMADTYRITLQSHIVSAPDAAAAPELEKLNRLARDDAALLAGAYGLKYPSPSAPKDASADGDALRKKLGHYLSAMFYFEGEWYWGVDRLHFLEERLHGAGLAKSRGPFRPIAPVKEVTFAGKPGSARGATLDYFLSFRSPYTYLAAARVRKLAEHYGAELRLRFVLPMVMRGLPVPQVKRLYITLDTKREAERLGMPFGTVVDPVGRPTERGLAVLHHAIKAGKGPEFAESFLRGVFAEGIDAGSDAGLALIASRAGVTGDQVAAALRDESWRQVAETNRAELFELGLWGVPSFRVNSNRPHWGQDRLWAIEQELQ
jgi:2-hydroxychromene-2-carboxylate isomerase